MVIQTLNHEVGIVDVVVVRDARRAQQRLPLGRQAEAARALVDRRDLRDLGRHTDRLAHQAAAAAPSAARCHVVKAREEEGGGVAWR